MKRIVKQLTYACAALATVFFAASCSSDDFTNNEEEEVITPESIVPRNLTVSIDQGFDKLSSRAARAEDVTTRTTVNENSDGKTLSSNWAAGDVLKFYNLSTHEQMVSLGMGGTVGKHDTLKAVQNSDGAMEFTGKVTCANGHEIALFYPHVNGSSVTEVVGEASWKFTFDVSEQHGTLTDIADRFDFAHGNATVTTNTTSSNPYNPFQTPIDNGAASATVKMKNLAAICKFSFFKDGGTTPLTNIKQVIIKGIRKSAVISLHLKPDNENFIEYDKSYADSASIVVTPSEGNYFQDANGNPINYVYVSLLPKPIKPTISVRAYDDATGSDKFYTYSFGSTANIEASKYYRAPMKNPGEGKGELMISELYERRNPDTWDDDTAPAEKCSILELYNCGTADLTPADLAQYSIKRFSAEGNLLGEYTIQATHNMTVGRGSAEIETSTSGNENVCTGILCLRYFHTGDSKVDNLPGNFLNVGGSTTTRVPSYMIHDASPAMADVEPGEYIRLIKGGVVIDEVKVPDYYHSLIRNDNVNKPNDNFTSSEWFDRDLSKFETKNGYIVSNTFHTLGQRPTEVNIH
jgi:hypothetical protein